MTFKNFCQDHPLQKISDRTHLEKFFSGIAIFKTLWIFNKTLLKEGIYIKILCTFTIIYT